MYTEVSKTVSKASKDKNKSKQVLFESRMDDQGAYCGIRATTSDSSYIDSDDKDLVIKESASDWLDRVVQIGPRV